MFQIIEYGTNKVIEKGFKTKEDAKIFERQYHKSALLNNIPVHNWLTLIYEY